MRGGPIQQNLKELVVSNILLILAMLLLCSFAVVVHAVTISSNSKVKDKDMQKSSEEYWKHMLVITFIEAVSQAFSFVTNPALR